MLRRVAAGARASRAVSSARASPLTALPPRPLTAALPLLSASRTFSSRSDGDEKKNAASLPQSAAAAAAAAASSNTAAATAAQVFATNERGKAASSEDASSRAQKESADPQQEQQQQQPGATAAPSGIRSIGIKLSEDDELVRAFNSFSKTVNGCTQEEFLVGVKQAYASLAIVISAFVDKAQQPLVGMTESSKMIAAAHEAAKLLDQEFKPEARENAPAKVAADNVEASSAGAAATGAKVKGDPAQSSAASAVASMAAPGASSPKAKLQDTLVQHVVSTITSIVPISRHLAESIFNFWVMQREKHVNLSSIASPADYVLDSKLVIFARLDKPRIYFNSDNIGAEVDVTLNNDYLRNLDPSASQSVASKKGEAASSSKSATAATAAEDDDVDEGMIEVLTDTTANARSPATQEHTFLVDKKTRKLTQQSAPAAVVDASAAASATAAGASTTSANSNTTTPAATARPEGKGNTISRVQVTCMKADEKNARASTGSTAISSTTSCATIKATTETKPAAAGTAADPDACSVFIKVNGSALPPIPADARACALLTVDVVVPPERYAYNFEWFYKRIIGYENEYERIAAARVFASNSPKSLGNALDFVMRMITGKSVEFMFSKSIGRMIGIPEDVSETPPATRKLVCMYMDVSYKWVLADLITLAPVIETKLPKA